MLTIGIPVHDGPEYFEKLLATIKERTRSPFQLIVVEDHAVDEIKAIISKYSSQLNIHHFVNNKHRGVPYSWNKILNSALGDFVAILNSDIVLTQDWDLRALEIMKNNPEIGVLNFMTSFAASTQQIEGAFHNRYKWDEKQICDYAETLWNIFGREVVYPRRTVGFAFLLSRKAIEKTGWFDERFGVGLFEEIDYFQRLERAGFKNALAKGIYIHHYGSTSFEPKGELFYQKLLKKNEKLFQKKQKNNLPEEVSPELMFSLTIDEELESLSFSYLKGVVVNYFCSKGQFGHQTDCKGSLITCTGGDFPSLSAAENMLDQGFFIFIVAGPEWCYFHSKANKASESLSKNQPQDCASLMSLEQKMMIKEKWLNYHKAILDFAKNNPDISLIITPEKMLKSRTLIMEKVKSKFSVEICEDAMTLMPKKIARGKYEKTGIDAEITSTLGKIRRCPVFFS